MTKNTSGRSGAGLSRRQFTVLSVGAGVAAASHTSRGAPAVQSAEVQIRTADGQCDAAWVHPGGKRPWPGVILFTDALGLRPAMVAMAKRLAGDGYSVLVPNPFYRAARAPVFAKGFSFQNPEDMATLKRLREPLTPAAVARDATAYVAFLDAQPMVRKKTKLGVMGYCMGGPMTMQSAAAVPERVGAGASFHGGGLVTDKPDSPHLLVPQIKAQYYFAIAANDDERQPEAKDKLRAAFGAAQLPATIEVYPGTLHGWCVKDMPEVNGKPIYNEPQAERAWRELTALYKRVLV
ncbi:MAG TPA: dienelactone hydrolase family protein [Steroidobacteraceae bacterium]